MAKARSGEMNLERKPLRTMITNTLGNIMPSAGEIRGLYDELSKLTNGAIAYEDLEMMVAEARELTRRDTHQAMEGFIHNLNTMHSRGGNQVVFSSINYGTDTSAEGQMVIEELMEATMEGLGAGGEVPVFPIQIFKVKERVSYSSVTMNWQ